MKIKKEIYVLLAVGILPMLFMRFGATDIMDNKVLMRAGESLFSLWPYLFGFIVLNMLRKKQVAPKEYYFLSYSIVYFSSGYFFTSLVDGLKLGIFGGVISAFVGYYVIKVVYEVLEEKLEWVGTVLTWTVMAYLMGLALGAGLSMLYEGISQLLIKIAWWSLDLNTSTSALLYGIGEKAVMPLGLHETFRNVFWYEYGSYQGFQGDYFRWLLRDPNSGTFMTGYYPVVLFGLVGYVGGMSYTRYKKGDESKGFFLLVMLIVSLVTGITEPLELAILLMAPLLYVVHVLLTGVSFALCSMLGIKLGFTFSSGLIDYVAAFGKGQKATGSIFIGLLFFGVYGFVYLYLYEYQRVKEAYLTIRSKIIPMEYLEKRAYLRSQGSQIEDEEVAEEPDASHLHEPGAGQNIEESLEGDEDEKSPHKVVKKIKNKVSKPKKIKGYGTPLKKKPVEIIHREAPEEEMPQEECEEFYTRSYASIPTNKKDSY